MKSHLITFVLVLCCAAAAAQDSLEARAERVRQEFSRPVSQWDDKFLSTAVQDYLGLYIQLLWSPDLKPRISKYLPSSQPAVRVEVTTEMRTPYMSGTEMVIPVEFLRYLLAIGQLVGHDSYLQDHVISLPNPILSGPFQNQILPLLDPLSAFLEPETFVTFQPYLRCPPNLAGCETVQQYGLLSLAFFAILHELSHEALHHSRSEEGINLNHEIDADKNAWHVLVAFARELKDLPPDILKEVRFELTAGPVVFLRTESSRLSPANAILQARAETMENYLGPQDLFDVEALLGSGKTANNISHLSVDWSAEPEKLFIDGVSLRPEDIRRKNLTVTSQSHAILALRSDGIASAVISGDSAEKRAFLEFKHYNTVGDADLQKLREKRDWLGILIVTTTIDLQPKQSAYSFLHSEALHRLHLDRYIHVDDWSGISASDARKVVVWQKNAETLSSWR